MIRRFALLLWFSVLVLSSVARGEVTRVEVTRRSDIAFAGYERLEGKVHFAVDPRMRANRDLADVARAPRNRKGLVEFSADFLLYRPKDRAKSNGTALVEIPNRGGVTATAAFDANAAGRGVTPQDLGDLFLFKEGFTVVWIGWQWDVPPGPGRILLYPPVLKGVTGPVRAEILVDKRATVASLGDRNMIPYAVADPGSMRMSVRDSGYGTAIDIPRAKWRLSADGSKVEYLPGFEPGRIYEVVYTAKDPVVASLGLASVRDYVAHIKEHGIARPGDVKRVIGYGHSQSGRFLRTFLAAGLNADEHAHRVFDAIWANASGSGRGGFNQRFSQPSRMAGQFNGFGYAVDVPPYTPEELLAASEKERVAPKLILTNGSHEYWGRAASLNHTSADGKRDLEIPAGVRIYFEAGTQHTPATVPTRGISQNLTNPLEYRYFQRALLVAVNAWITNGTEPPPSVAPRIDKGELVPVSAWRFPKVPGIEVPHEAYAPRRLDFGPEFLKTGVVAWDPPKTGQPVVTLVPQVNSDGNEIGGVQLPELRVPLATYTGWNLRSELAGATQELYPLLGSMIPFPKTRADRGNDPRRSIAERYKDEADYLKRVEDTARDLAKRRYLLDADVPQVVSRARFRWGSLMNGR